jgi:hypothetical protein
MAGCKDAAAILCPALRFFSSGKDISTHRDFTILTIFSLYGYVRSGGNDAAAMLCPTLRFFSSNSNISNPTVISQESLSSQCFTKFSLYDYVRSGGKDAAAMLCPTLRFFSSGKDISTHRDFTILTIFSLFGYAMSGGNDAAAMLCPTLRFFSSGRDISNPFSAGNSSAIVRLQLSSNTAPPLPAVTLPKSRTCFTS